MQTGFARLVIVLALCCASLSGSAAPSPRYTIAPLPPLPGDTHSGALAINDRGQVAGWSGKPRDKDIGPRLLSTVYTLWRDGVPLKPDISISLTDSEGWAIDAEGDALIRTSFHANRALLEQQGKSAEKNLSVAIPASLDRVYLWRNGKIEEPDLRLAECLTSNGSILAAIDDGDGPAMVIWRNGESTKLQDGIFPVCMNDRGQIAGMTQGSQICVYDHGKVTPLTMPQGFSRPYFVRINQSGQVIYEARATDRTAKSDEMPPSAAFFWDNGKTVEVRANTTSSAFNDHAQIVGWGLGSGGFLWENGYLSDLASLLPPGSGWTGLEPAGINNAGQIVGDGLYKGLQRAFVMTPAR